ncbi:MAG: hypothetical protein KGL39_18165 [Patescibacteria group bacterium]|nr:hypothetical protein [Patescibacteria group bacterium]
MIKRLIGISGKAAAGKDTTADFIVASYGAVKMSLADEIKRTAKRFWGFQNAQLWGASEKRQERPLGKPNAPTARHACQQLGTEVARLIDRDVWINLLLGNAANLQQYNLKYFPAEGLKPNLHYDHSVYIPYVVVPDVRYQNEMDAIKANGGYLIRIVRPGFSLTGEAANHPSETEQDAIPDSFFHYVLHNDGSLEQLEDKVHTMLRELGVTG